MCKKCRGAERTNLLSLPRLVVQSDGGWHKRESKSICVLVGGDQPVAEGASGHFIIEGMGGVL